MTMPENPLPAYSFLITLDPGDVYLPPAQAALVTLAASGAFERAGGLSGELEVMPYAEGGVNDAVHQLPVRHSWGRIVLGRGVVRDAGLWTWYQIGLHDSLGARRDGAVIALTRAGQPALAWEFRGGLAAKWTGPEFNAGQDAVAVETLEIAHEGLRRVPLSPPDLSESVLPALRPPALPGLE